MYKSILIYFLWGKIKYGLLGYPISILLLRKETHPVFHLSKEVKYYCGCLFSFIFLFISFLPSKNLLIICFPSFCPTKFLFCCCFDSFCFLPDNFFFQFVIVPSTYRLLAYRITRSLVRCVMPVIFSSLCPWQGKGLPLLTCSPVENTRGEPAGGVT